MLSNFYVNSFFLKTRGAHLSEKLFVANRKNGGQIGNIEDEFGWMAKSQIGFGPIF